MRIALVSFEYAGVGNGGGIGTYMRNATAMLAARGHDVEVFSAAPGRSGQVLHSDGAVIHLLAADRIGFASAAARAFEVRHNDHPFDVVEGPEYGSDAREIRRAHPGVPLVVKLHAPTFTIDESNWRHVSLKRRARFWLGALRRRRWARSPWRYRPAADSERIHALEADLIVANSNATRAKVGKAWGLQDGLVETVPYVFVPPPDLLSQTASLTRDVLFLGRVEVRKGVLELARAIPLVLNEFPDARFRLVGRILPHPDDGAPLDQHIRRILGNCNHAVDIPGAVPYSEVPAAIARASVCVFPSDWEASGFVCMEAMAAGRGVVGSLAGGMTEIIEHGRTGFLAPPRNPAAIARAISTLLADPSRISVMGAAARAHVLEEFAPEKIAPLQEASYRKAIANAKVRTR